MLDALDRRAGAVLPRRSADRVRRAADDADARSPRVWDLVWAGHLSNDTLAPLRALLGGSGAHRRHGAGRALPRAAATGRPLGRAVAAARRGPARRSAAGRWYRLPERDLDPTRRATALADALLERHGVVTRGAVMAEGVDRRVRGGLPGARRAGGARRGPARLLRRGPRRGAVRGARRGRPAARPRRATGGPGARHGPRLVLAATDPANPYGAALPWPERVVESGAGGTGHRPGRKAGALVVLVDGELVLYVERGGRTLLSFVDDPEALAAAAQALGRRSAPVRSARCRWSGPTASRSTAHRCATR